MRGPREARVNRTIGKTPKSSVARFW